jgi:hypothetical protein
VRAEDEVNKGYRRGSGRVSFASGNDESIKTPKMERMVSSADIKAHRRRMSTIFQQQRLTLWSSGGRNISFFTSSTK